MKRELDPAIVERLKEDKPHLFVCRRCTEAPTHIPAGYCDSCWAEIRLRRNRKEKVRLRSRSSSRARDIMRGACSYCGARPDASEMTLDHIMPVALGGTSDPTNLLACCKACNKAKGDRPFWEFVQELFAAQAAARNPYRRRLRIGLHQAEIRRQLGISWEEWNRPAWERPYRGQYSSRARRPPDEPPHLSGATTAAAARRSPCARAGGAVR